MPTWLAVEDEAGIHDVIMAMFEAWGIGGISFVDSAEAIRWIDSVDNGEVKSELPELALIDIRLPGPSGVEVATHIRKSHTLSKIALVLTTAYRLTPQEELRMVQEAGADALIYKPLPNMPALRIMLNDIVAKRKESA